MQKYQDFAKQKHSTRKRIIALALAGVFFLFLFPYLIIRWSDGLDQWLGFPGFDLGLINIIPGILIAAGGFFFAWWSIYAEITIGLGTPLPMIPTQKLVIKPPFTYCRNPMTLGTFLGYLGFGVILGSISAILIVVLFTGLLLLYVKFIEEKELEVRFGEEYLEYKKKTPFIFPRFRRGS
jgi:protein-S-isoprenylcysteine O-methyltransferase Ste14